MQSYIICLTAIIKMCSISCYCLYRYKVLYEFALTLRKHKNRVIKSMISNQRIKLNKEILRKKLQGNDKRL